LWPVLALALPAFIVCASYVNILTDLPDAKDDLGERKISPLARIVLHRSAVAPCGLRGCRRWLSDCLA